MNGSLELNASTAAGPPGAEAAPSSRRGLHAMLWPILRPYKWTLITATGLNAFHGIAIAFQTLIPKYILDDVVLAEGISNTTRYTRLGLLLGAFLFASIIGRMIIWHVSYRMFTSVREKLLFALRRRFFSHVNHLCLRFHRTTHSGELFSYLFGSPLGQITGYYNHFAMAIPGAVFNFVWTLVWVSMWDWAMTAVLLVSVVGTVCLMQRAQGQIKALWEDYQKAEGEVSGQVADLLRGTRDVKLFAYEDRVVDHFSQHVQVISQKSYDRDIKTHMQHMRHEGMGYVCFALLCAMGAWRYQQGLITVGELQAYLTAYWALQWPLGSFFQLFINLGTAQAGMTRIDGVLQTASSTPDPVGYIESPPRGAPIRLVNVDFAYEKDRPVLRGVNLTIPYGQHVALVGPSGSGKSTLAQLLLRMYDPDAGAVALGGLNLRHCIGAELRSRFGVVPQDPFIFRTTVRENLRVADPNATDEQIRAACERANAWEFIEKLPQGLDTSLAEGGATLSGGQRQRLAIARALLKDPDYFLFDEATSALDSNSEALIQDAIENAWKGRTAVIIAHRLSTVRNCDRILVMSEGRIVQDGSYDDLLRRPGLFRDLVHGQELGATEPLAA